MSKNVIKGIKFRAYWLILVQVLLVLLACSIAFILSGWNTAYSMLIGGLISVVPNLYFAKKFFQKMYARNAHQIIKKFYRNEVVKLTLMGLLFIAAIKLKIAADKPLVLGFVIAQIGVFLMPLIYCFDENRLISKSVVTNAKKCK